MFMIFRHDCTSFSVILIIFHYASSLVIIVHHFSSLFLSFSSCSSCFIIRHIFIIFIIFQDWCMLFTISYNIHILHTFHHGSTYHVHHFHHFHTFYHIHKCSSIFCHFYHCSIIFLSLLYQCSIILMSFLSCSSFFIAFHVFIVSDVFSSVFTAFASESRSCVRCPSIPGSQLKKKSDEHEKKVQKTYSTRCFPSPASTLYHTLDNTIYTNFILRSWATSNSLTAFYTRRTYFKVDG